MISRINNSLFYKKTNYSFNCSEFHEMIFFCVEIKILEAFSEAWKNLEESIRKQGKEASKCHQARQDKAREREAIERSPAYIQLQHRQAEAFRSFDGGNINNRHLYLPV